MNHINFHSVLEQEKSAPAHLLIVDDEPANREILRGLLEQEQYDVIEASNGMQAISLAIEERPDIILLDVMMPGMDGFAVCESLQNYEATASIPVVLITSLSSPHDEAKGLAAGAIDYITKPINPTVVSTRIRAHLQLKRQRDELVNRTEKLFFTNKLLEQEIEAHLNTEGELRSARDEIAAANIIKDGLIKDLFQAMCEMLSSRDMYTFEHGLRVASLSRLVGEELKLSSRQLDALEIGGMLHDISKVAIPDDILLKPGLFDNEDRKIMRMHPSMGANIFKRRSCDPLIIDIIHHHHERLDGSGYPEGLKGDDIGLLPRIAMVTDTYEALISQRSYKKPLLRQEALETLRSEAKSGRLDNEMVEILAKVTQYWEPLELGHDFSDSNTNALEIFRKKTYFREPLSDFYNYRYLLYLDDAGLLNISEEGFTLLGISFVNIEHINKIEGYLKADQIIDDAGSIMHEIIEETINKEAGNCLNILLRKEKLYIIYSNCPEDVLEDLSVRINRFIEIQASNLGLKSRLIQLHFNQDKGVEDAVYELIARGYGQEI